MRRVVAALFLAVPADAQTVPQFVEQSSTAGINHSYTGGWQYMVGGGVAVFDCNGDALPELFMAGGTTPASLWRNASPTGGDLVFSAVSGSGLEQTEVTGAWPLDFDNDGLTDLAVLRVGPDRLMRGRGDCRFEDVSAKMGFDGGDAWSTAFAATWEQGQTLPTLAFGAYIDRLQEAFPWGSCTANTLHRPDGSRYAAPTPLLPSHCALSMLFTDWNGAGRPALRVSNDREYYKGGQEQLWHVDPTVAPQLYTEAEGWQRLRIWGMGIASTDLNADGFPEFFLTSMADSKLQTLAAPGPAAKPRYADLAFAKGVTAHRPYIGDDLRPSTGWHAQFADVNNDGLSDLFVVKGNVSEMPDFAALDPNNLLMQREDGTFAEVGDAAGVASTLQGRGGAVVDMNADGRLDMVVVNRNGPVQVWRNAGPVGNWVSVDVQQVAPNRNAVQAWVELRSAGALQRHEITVGGGHGGGILGPQHFGIGTATEAEVRVIWPDGAVGDWSPAAANTTVDLQR